jgi:hypothetical protein
LWIFPRGGREWQFSNPGLIIIELKSDSSQIPIGFSQKLNQEGTVLKSSSAVREIEWNMDRCQVWSRKRFTLSSVLNESSESYFKGMKPPKIFQMVSKMTARVFTRSSHRFWNCCALKPSRLHRHRTESSLPKELCEDLQKVRIDRRINRRNWRRWSQRLIFRPSAGDGLRKLKWRPRWKTLSHHSCRSRKKRCAWRVV